MYLNLLVLTNLLKMRYIRYTFRAFSLFSASFANENSKHLEKNDGNLGHDQLNKTLIRIQSSLTGY